MPLCKLCNEVITVSPLDVQGTAARPGPVFNQVGREALECIRHLQLRHPQETLTINSTIATVAQWLTLRHYQIDDKLRAGQDAATARFRSLVDAVQAEAETRRAQEAAEAYRAKLEAEEPPRLLPGKPR